MVAFPAFCPNCGLVFGSGVVLENARNVTIGNARQNCPRCGAWAELPAGTFNVIGDTIEVLAGSGLTRERMFRLRDILERAESEHADSAQAIEAVIAEAPDLRPLVERYGPKMQKALIKFLLFLFTVLIAQGVSELRDDSATREDVRKAVEQAVQKQQRR